MTTVKCPTCKTDVVWSSEAEFRPFCSNRCKLIDLGEWADEGHKISQPVQGGQPLTEDMLDALEEQFIQNDNFFVDPNE